MPAHKANDRTHGSNAGRVAKRPSITAQTENAHRKAAIKPARVVNKIRVNPNMPMIVRHAASADGNRTAAGVRPNTPTEPATR